MTKLSTVQVSVHMEVPEVPAVELIQETLHTQTLIVPVHLQVRVHTLAPLLTC